MFLFWSLALLLLAGTLAFLLPPLLRHRRPAAAPDDEAAAIAVYRDQKRALDAEFADGVISAAERDAAVSELTRRLGEEVGQPKPTTSSRPSRRAWTIALALFVLIPLVALGLYRWLGNPDAMTLATAGNSTTSQHSMSDPQLAAMVESLAQKMKSRPDDAEGWTLLGRSYAAMGRYSDSADAYAHAASLVSDDAALLADYADTLAMAQGRSLAGKPSELIQRALAIDPKNPKALALAATAALDARDFDAALGYWRRLQAQFPDNSDDARQVGSIIAEIETAQREGKGVAGGKLATRTERPAPPQTSAPAPKPVAGATIAGRVDIAPALASKVALSDTVFIFARAVDGPRVPLAVLRVPAGELPKSFTLDDSMGMAPGAKLSAAQSVVIEARVSKSGNALPQSGDLSGKSAAVKPGAAGVQIVIDQVVP
ncbi:MAG TPA: c-type cytochrome biogenesis protein CcmI [Casimicrobiaceae bacterium]|nr:c-type cytochrome biogenesis protein CcmI [Casimicrobiaceae bacterium]